MVKKFDFTPAPEPTSNQQFDFTPAAAPTQPQQIPFGANPTAGALDVLVNTLNLAPEAVNKLYKTLGIKRRDPLIKPTTLPHDPSSLGYMGGQMTGFALPMALGAGAVDVGEMAARGIPKLAGMAEEQIPKIPAFLRNIAGAAVGGAAGSPTGQREAGAGYGAAGGAVGQAAGKVIGKAGGAFLKSERVKKLAELVKSKLPISSSDKYAENLLDDLSNTFTDMKNKSRSLYKTAFGFVDSQDMSFKKDLKNYRTVYNSLKDTKESGDLPSPILLRGMKADEVDPDLKTLRRLGFVGSLPEEIKPTSHITPFKVHLAHSLLMKDYYGLKESGQNIRATPVKKAANALHVDLINFMRKNGGAAGDFPYQIAQDFYKERVVPYLSDPSYGKIARSIEDYRLPSGKNYLWTNLKDTSSAVKGYFPFKPEEKGLASLGRLGSLLPTLESSIEHAKNIGFSKALTDENGGTEVDWKKFFNIYGNLSNLQKSYLFKNNDRDILDILHKEKNRLKEPSRFSKFFRQVIGAGLGSMVGIPHHLGSLLGFVGINPLIESGEKSLSKLLPSDIGKLTKQLKGTSEANKALAAQSQTTTGASLANVFLNQPRNQ